MNENTNHYVICFCPPSSKIDQDENFPLIPFVTPVLAKIRGDGYDADYPKDTMKEDKGASNKGGSLKKAAKFVGPNHA